MDITEVVRRIKSKQDNHKPQYSFLEDESVGRTILSTHLAWCLDHPHKLVHVYVCLYRRNSSTVDGVPVEYVSFFMEKSGDKYTFPSFTYRCSDTIEDAGSDYESDSDSEDRVDNSLKTKCLQKMLDIHEVKHHLDIHSHHPNRGFGYMGLVSDGNSVFAVFDGDVLIEKRSEKRSVWAITDEIVHKKSVRGIHIDPVIVRMFHKHPELWSIKFNGVSIDPPKQMYSVLDSHTMKLEDVHYPAHGKMAIPYKYSDQFGDRYMYTEGLNEVPNETEQSYKRYAVFIYQPTHVFSRDTYRPDQHLPLINKHSYNFMEEERDDDETIEFHRKIPMISFYDTHPGTGGRPTWGLTSPSLAKEIDE